MGQVASQHDSSTLRTRDIQLRTPTDGRLRTARLLVPDDADGEVSTHTQPTQGWPLVMMLHGAGGTDQLTLGATQWDKLAASEGFVVLVPNGTANNESRPARFLGNPQTWNSGQGSSLIAPCGQSSVAKNVDDVAFLEALLTHVQELTPIDPRRVYVAGHSNGAAMAYRFARERPELVAAVGTMAGHLGPPSLKRFASPVSLIHIVGDQDPFSPLEGGRVETRRVQIMTRAPRMDVGDWAAANGLTSNDDPRRVDRGDARIQELRWGGLESGEPGETPAEVEVRWIVVRDHGHQWCQSVGHRGRLLERVMGPNSDALDATSEMWRFFMGHPKPT